jgi:hypothetical protein
MLASASLQSLTMANLILSAVVWTGARALTHAAGHTGPRWKGKFAEAHHAAFSLGVPSRQYCDADHRFADKSLSSSFAGNESRRPAFNITQRID